MTDLVKGILCVAYALAAIILVAIGVKVRRDRQERITQKHQALAGPALLDLDRAEKVQKEQRAAKRPLGSRRQEAARLAKRAVVRVRSVAQAATAKLKRKQ